MLGQTPVPKDTKMLNKLRQRGQWSNSELNDVKCLVEHNFSPSKIGEIFKTTKNADIGALYRDKIKNGYVPPED